MLTANWLECVLRTFQVFIVHHGNKSRKTSSRRSNQYRSQVLIESLESRTLLTGAYLQTNLTSDGSVPATNTDPNLVNPWGFAAAPGGAFWVSDNGTGKSTLYDGSGNVVPAVFTVPAPTGHSGASTPTGIVYNSTSDFSVTGGPSQFIFSTEDGTISGWNSGSSAEITVDRSATGAVYKGLATGNVGTTNFLYATNFHAGKIEVFDKNFSLVTPTGTFTDPGIPAGYAPFGIQNVGGNLIVTYALQDAAKHDDVPGAGHGFVSEFSPNGTFIREIGAHGTLNSPWGIAMAPSTFGSLSGDLLVGNFGDGTISAYNLSTGTFQDQLKNSSGTAIAIQGLWALEFGNGGQSANPNDLFFTAGPGGEKHGLFGKLDPISTFSITTSTLSNWTQNQVGYDQVIATSNGTSPLAFSILSGNLPTGLSLSSTSGAITGKPSATGSFTFTVKVTDKTGATASHAYTVTINAALAITTTTLANWTVNQAGYNQTPTTTGGTGPLTFSVLSGNLPGGLSLSSTSGAIAGKPTAAGAVTFTLKITDKAGATATHAYTVTINAALAITTTTIANWTVNQAGYNQTPTTTGGTGPLTFGVLSGNLPGGLNLSSSSGAITGKPTAAGKFTFTLKVIDKAGATATHAYTVTINSALAITTMTLANWTVNQAGYSQTPTTTGGTGPLTFSVLSGNLPGGLSLSSSSGAITGKPTAAGTFTFTLKVTDKAGATATHAYTVTINSALAITTMTLANWTVNKAGYNQAITTSGGTGPLVFSVLSGTLPTGLSLDLTTGAITGKPTVTGSFTFVLKALDKSGAIATHSYTIKIVA